MPSFDLATVGKKLRVVSKTSLATISQTTKLRVVEETEPSSTTWTVTIWNW